jgi:hypothetical protein
MRFKSVINAFFGLVKKQNKLLILFLFLTFIIGFVRFWHFNELLNFHGDPPFFLMEVQDMLDSRKLRLTGPIVKSQMVMGRGFFTGPLLYYFIALLGTLFSWNVYIITFFFSSFWLIALFITFFWFKEKYNELTALLIFLFFGLFPLMLPHSRTIWNPHFLPLLGIILLYFLDKRKSFKKSYFFAGVAFGLGINAHYAAFLWLFIIMFYFFRDFLESRKRIKLWGFFVLGIILGELPLIIFEIKHQFYNTQTIIFQIKSGGLLHTSNFNQIYYYLFPLLPLMIVIMGNFVSKLLKSKLKLITSLSFISIAIIFLYVDLGYYGQDPIFPSDLNIKNQQVIVNEIIKDNEQHFTVAETVSGDTQATEIRWWLRKAGKSVVAVDKYPEANICYLIAKDNRPPESEDVWEISSLKPFRVEYKKTIADQMYLYKLVKIK